jgi:SAM-dependent methyltransferase
MTTSPATGLALGPTNSTAGSEPIVAATFNATLLAHVLHALTSSGLDESLHAGLHRDQADADEPRERVLDACLKILADHRLVNEHDGHVVLTEMGRDLFAARGFFTWLLGGYSPLLGALGARLRSEPVAATRDDGQVALGSAQVDQSYLRQHVRQILLGLGLRHIADLGCGDGSRLLDFLAATKDTTALGVDRAPAAVALAQRQAVDAGLADRLRIVQADCLAPLDPPDAQVDCVMSFFLLHDMLQARGGNLAPVLADIQRNYPAARMLLLADTTCDDWVGTHLEPPVFARGFELVHALMGIQLRTLAEYRALFDDAGAPLADVLPLNVPNGWLFQVDLA